MMLLFNTTTTTVTNGVQGYLNTVNGCVAGVALQRGILRAHAKPMAAPMWSRPSAERWKEAEPRAAALQQGSLLDPARGSGQGRVGKSGSLRTGIDFLSSCPDTAGRISACRRSASAS